ncbi:hypothetical protein BGZ83_001254 [Gryganskiella cystojenkinii]|nr:hypothetical protein BGZ83_001254 [Gryganskiella cystojenkinii]
MLFKAFLKENIPTLTKDTNDTGLQDLCLEYNDDAVLEDLCLEDLTILFQDDPKDPVAVQAWQPPSQPSGKPIDVRPLLRIFRRSKHLKTLTIGSKPFESRGQLVDQARLLAGLPSSIEKLTIRDWPNRRKSPIDQGTIDAMLDVLSNTPETMAKLNNLKTLSLFSCAVDGRVLSALAEQRCPALDELDYNGFARSWDLSELLLLISKGSSKGWKTLGFKYCCFQLDEAILEHAATLENIRIDGPHFSSSFIQRLLCSAPRLKRFDVIPKEHHHEPPTLLANDVISSDFGAWVCLNLESFKCPIGGVPRPDLGTTTTGEHLTGDGRDRYTMQRSRHIQYQVLSQLGKLTKLREITLGQDNINPGEASEEDPEPSDDEDMGRQYDCLMMTLEAGLGQLKDLKQLRRICLEKMSHCQGPQEEQWMKENWPDYGKESRDGFWSERGHGVMEGPRLDRSKVMVASHGPNRFDWW